MRSIFTGILYILSLCPLWSQQQHTLPSVIRQGDTIPYIRLEEVVVRKKTKSENWYNRQYRRQTRLEYNVRRVYPYARIAASKVNEIEHKLANVAGDAARKQIVKDEYSTLMKTFKAPLSKLSVNQGKILVRLIYRETNNTSFAHIRQYKGTVNAYFWQSIALLFGNNLKASYDPYGADAAIEEVVKMIEQGL